MKRRDGDGAGRERRDGAAPPVPPPPVPPSGERRGGERRREELALRRNLKDQEIVAAILRESLRPEPLETLLDSILALVLSSHGLSLEARGAVFLCDESGTALILGSQQGLDPDTVSSCSRIPLGNCLCGLAAESGELIHAVCGDPRHAVVHRTSHPPGHPHGHYCVPIKSGDALLGVLTLYVPEGHGRSPEEDRFVTIVADTLAGVIRRKRAEDDLRHANDALERQVEERTRELRREIDGHRATETALRESRERYRRVIETAAEGFWMIDASFRAVEVNDALCRMLDYQREDILGRSLLDFAAAENQTFLRDLLASSLWDGRRSFEVALRGRNGRTVSTEFHATTLVDSSGRMTGLFAFVTDMTDRKKAEVDLRLANARTEAASKAKSEFLAGMSHELRTPLNAVIGFSDAILAEIFGPLGNDRYLDYVEDIRRSGFLLLDLINDILDIAKVEAGRMDLHEEVVRVEHVVDASLRLIRPRAEKCGVRLHRDLPDELPGLYVDERRLKQVLLNLLSNAVKFAPGGDVAVRAWVGGDGWLAVAVADNGIGMSDEDLIKALEPFGQADSSVTRAEGTGLGLPLSKRLVEAHGGVFVVASEPGVGTTVSSRFPAARVHHGE
ncbi:MAG: PAS domain S-box protein [Alphaproteobacteria bacterium]|nr:PAS domain S-box protein [Alphaproteobacteria bacterium]